MSRSKFALRFKELLRQGPVEYVTEWRMQKAVRLLQARDKKLFEIAKNVGYDSDAAFSKAFKRVLGVTPGEHRRNSAQPAQVQQFRTPSSLGTTVEKPVTPSSGETQSLGMPVSIPTAVANLMID